MASHDSTSCPPGVNACPISNQVEALKNRVSELAEQVRTDPLTNLYNKRHLLSALDMELERGSRSQHPTSLIMLDIDHFKAFNDLHGHVVGDKILVHVASTIKNTIRKIDIACRYGGEEFAIILPSTPLLTADRVAERVREFITALTINLNNQELSVTASFGVSCFTCNSNPRSSEALIDRADQQLYKAKKLGRNKVCTEPPPQTTAANLTDAERLALVNADKTLNRGS